MVNDKELNVLCEYIYMPRLERFLDIALKAGYTAFLSVGGDGLPALEIDTEDGEFAISLLAYDTDIEEPEEVEDGDYELMVRMYLRTNGYDDDKKAGYMIFPYEATEKDSDFAGCLELFTSGIWALNVPEKIGCDSTVSTYMAAPRLLELSELLAEADINHTEIIYRDGEWPRIIANCSDRVVTFSYILFGDDEGWVLRMQTENEEGIVKTALFPDFGEMRKSEFYEKELALFERFFM